MMFSLLDSGYSLNEAVILLSRNDVSKPVRLISIQISEYIRKGFSFVSAITAVENAYGKPIFPPYYVSLISGVEHTGRIIQSFSKLTERLERKAALQEQFFLILVYPCFIILLSIVASLFLLSTGIPYIIKMGFFDENLTASMTAGVFFALSIMIIMSFCFGLVIYFFIGQESSESIFFSILWDFSESGLPVSHAIQTCISTIKDKRMAPAFVLIKKELAAGSSLVSSFRKTKMFPDFVTDLLNVGNDTGDLSKVLKRVFNYYDNRDKKRRGLLLRVCEPVIIVITGVYLLVLLNAVVLPLLTAFGGVL